LTKVSVVIATYNGSKYLEEQLRSILSQTRLPSEIVLSDDGSSDGTRELAERILHPSGIPYRIILNEGPRGSTGNFENAFRKSTGEIVFLCDQDDSWRPDKIEIQAGILEKDPSLGFCFSDATLVDSDLRPIGKSLWTSMNLHGLISRFKMDQKTTLIRRPLVTGAGAAFRKGALEISLPFDRQWIHDRWASLICACVDVKGASVPQELFLYRQHQAQQVSALADQTLRKKFDFVRGISGPDCIIDARRWLSVHRRLVQLHAPEAACKAVFDTAVHLRVRGRIRQSGFCLRLRLAERERRLGRYQYSSFPVSWARDIFLGQG